MDLDTGDVRQRTSSLNTAVTECEDVMGIKEPWLEETTQVKDFIASECVFEEEVCHDLAEGAQTQ